MKIEYIGKSLLIEEGGERVLVVSDLHLGYDQSMRDSGAHIPIDLYGEIIKDLDRIFEKIKKVDKLVVLGDLKHEFGNISWGEREDLGKFFDYLDKKTDEVIIVKGNHDRLIDWIKMNGRKIKIVDFFDWRGVCFLHGDREFKEIYSNVFKLWIMGHAHPAVVLKECVKEEKYKCFLVGEFGDRKVICMPSFFPLIVGVAVNENCGRDLNLAWNFNFGKFNVCLVGDDLEVLEFGLLQNLN